MDQEQDIPVVYAGFWARAWAWMIDSFLLMPILVPAKLLLARRFQSGWGELFLSWLLPCAIVLFFWRWKGATPGKMAMSLRIVGADDLAPPSWPRLIGRYLSYLLSMVFLFLGCFWIAFDPKKQGWHDKLAGTVVIREGGAERAGFPWKAAALALAALALGIGALVPLGSRWFAKVTAQASRQIEKVRPEAKQFAQGRDQSACFSEALRRLREEDSVAGQIAARVFLSVCLEAAAPTDGFCADVPQRDEVAKTIRWILWRSEELGCEGNECRSLLTEVQRSCAPVPLAAGGEG